MAATNARGLIEGLKGRHGWDDEACLAMVAGYADEQEAYWTTPSLPGTAPRSFAEFLADVEARFLRLVEQEQAPSRR
jgi:hypothetical protein